MRSRKLPASVPMDALVDFQPGDMQAKVIAGTTGTSYSRCTAPAHFSTALSLAAGQCLRPYWHYIVVQCCRMKSLQSIYLDKSL